MISKPLSKAHQRVMDWLAESPEHELVRHTNWNRRGNLYSWAAYWCPHRCGPKTCEALRPHLVRKSFNGLLATYIHPKFAGGTDDPAN